MSTVMEFSLGWIGHILSVPLVMINKILDFCFYLDFNSN